MRVSDMDRVWNEILASPVRIISPPEIRGESKKALFILPGGQTTALVER